jgi:hypothetical protein
MVHILVAIIVSHKDVGMALSKIKRREFISPEVLL